MVQISESARTFGVRFEDWVGAVVSEHAEARATMAAVAARIRVRRFIEKLL
jgi:hypothetical protein